MCDIQHYYQCRQFDSKEGNQRSITKSHSSCHDKLEGDTEPLSRRSGGSMLSAVEHNVSLADIVEEDEGENTSTKQSSPTAAEFDQV